MAMSAALSGQELAWRPMTEGELVSQIWTKTVTGSCSERSAWLQTRPLKVSSTARHAATAPRNAKATPMDE